MGRPTLGPAGGRPNVAELRVGATNQTAALGRSTTSFTRRGIMALRTTSGFTLRKKSIKMTGDSTIIRSI